MNRDALPVKTAGSLTEYTPVSDRSFWGGLLYVLGHLTPLPEFRGNYRERGPRSLKNAPQGFRPPWGSRGPGRGRVYPRGAGRGGYAAAWWVRAHTLRMYTLAVTGAARAGVRVRGFWGKKGRLPDGVCRVPGFQTNRTLPGGGRKKPVFARFLSLVHKRRGAGLCS